MLSSLLTKSLQNLVYKGSNFKNMASVFAFAKDSFINFTSTRYSCAKYINAKLKREKFKYVLKESAV